MITLYLLKIMVLFSLNLYLSFVFSAIYKKLDYNFSWFKWIPFSYLFLLPVICKKKWYYIFLFIFPFVWYVFSIIFPSVTFYIIDFSKYGSLIFYVYAIFLVAALMEQLSILFNYFNLPKILCFLVIGFFIPGISVLILIIILIILGYIAWSKRNVQKNVNPVNKSIPLNVYLNSTIGSIIGIFLLILIIRSLTSGMDGLSGIAFAMFFLIIGVCLSIFLLYSYFQKSQV